MPYFVAIVIAFLIALFITLGMKAALKTARFDRYVTNYVDAGSFEITASRDDYINTETTRVRIRNESNRE